MNAFSFNSIFPNQCVLIRNWKPWHDFWVMP